MKNRKKSIETKCNTIGCKFLTPRDKNMQSKGAYCNGCRVTRKRAKLAGFNPNDMSFDELTNKFWNVREKQSILS